METMRVAPSQVQVGDRLVTAYPTDAVVQSWEVAGNGTVTARIAGLLSGSRLDVQPGARVLACCRLRVPPFTVTYLDGGCGGHLLTDRTGFLVEVRAR